jgi:AcrR family transcriptional regulator
MGSTEVTIGQGRTRGRPKNEQLRTHRREQILDAATTLFARHGYRNTDVQYVADALEVGKGTVYRYFPSKEALFLGAVDQAMRRLTEHFQRHVHSLPDPLQRARRAVFEYLTFFQQHPEYVELLIQERAEFRDRQKPTYFVHRDAHVERWRELFRGLIAAGRVRDVPVDRICDVLSDLLYGTMFTNYFAARRRPVEAQAQDILDIVFHGVLSEAERGRLASGSETRRPARPRRRKS